MREFLLGGGYATGIFAFDDIFKLLGEGNFFLLDKLAVLDDINGNAGINVAENVKVNVVIGVDFNDVLLPSLRDITFLMMAMEQSSLSSSRRL